MRIQKNWKRKGLITYSLLIHVCLVIILIKPEYVNKVYHRLGLIDKPMSNHHYYMETQWSYFGRRSETLKKESKKLVFLGNSITNGLCVESIFNGLNFGISGESISRAKSRIKLLSNLDYKKIVLAYGINDIPGNSADIYEDYVQLINEIPKNAIVYISSILPVNEEIYRNRWGTEITNRQIKELNKLLKGFTANRENVYYMDTAKNLYNFLGQLEPNYQKGDGIHLNKTGNLIWANSIRDEMTRINKSIEDSHSDKMLNEIVSYTDNNTLNP